MKTFSKRALLRASAAPAILGASLIASAAMAQDAPQAAEADMGDTIVPADTPSEFAHHIHALLSDSTHRTTMGRQGRLNVLEHFGWEAATATLVTVLKDLAGTR